MFTQSNMKTLIITKRKAILYAISIVCLLCSCRQGDAPNYYDGTKPTKAPTESTEDAFMLDDMYLTDKYMVDTIDMNYKKLTIKYMSSEAKYSKNGTPYILITFKLTNDNYIKASTNCFFIQVYQNKKFCNQKVFIDNDFYSYPTEISNKSSDDITLLYELEDDTIPIIVKVNAQYGTDQQVQEISWDSIKK